MGERGDLVQPGPQGAGPRWAFAPRAMAGGAAEKRFGFGLRRQGFIPAPFFTYRPCYLGQVICTLNLISLMYKIGVVITASQG